MNQKQYQGRSLQYLVVEPDGYDPDREYPLVILLHGFGSNMGDLAALTPAINRTGYLYACPNAPLAMDIGMGQVGYAWTNLHGDSYERDVQDAEVKLVDFVAEVTEQYAVTGDRVLLGGFSQGGVMTYQVGLPRREQFAGLFALSARVAEPNGLLGRLPDRRDQPIFVSHGRQDMMITVEDGREARRLLDSWNYSPEYHEHDMAHEITQEVIDDLVEWMNKVVPPLLVE
jgi:phospholipase/carboxylesterase